eukprot:s3483_g3.t1
MEIAQGKPFPEVTPKPNEGEKEQELGEEAKAAGKVSQVGSMQDQGGGYSDVLDQPEAGAEVTRLQQQAKKRELDEKAREAKGKGKGKAKGRGRGQGRGRNGKGRGKGRGKGKQPKTSKSTKAKAKAKATAKSKSKKSQAEAEAAEANPGDEVGEVKKPSKRSRAKATIPEPAPAPANKTKTKEKISTFAGRYKPTTETMGGVWEALRRKYVPFWRFALNKWGSEKVQLDQLDSDGLADAAHSAGEAFLQEPTLAAHFISQ